MVPVLYQEKIVYRHDCLIKAYIYEIFTSVQEMEISNVLAPKGKYVVKYLSEGIGVAKLKQLKLNDIKSKWLQSFRLGYSESNKIIGLQWESSRTIKASNPLQTLL